MKFLSMSIGLIVSSAIVYAQKTEIQMDTAFSLSYISVGLGGNMFVLQPEFKIKGTVFVYTLEQEWVFKNRERVKPDTLYVGNLRTSAIDSILTLSKEVKGDSVYKWRSGTMSGGIIYLDISSKHSKLNFKLDNAFDPTAGKIINILNSYIPDKLRKLWISDLIPNIIRVK